MWSLQKGGGQEKELADILAEYTVKGEQPGY